MNAAIRGVVRTSLGQGWEVFGVRRGYAGLVAGSFVALNARDVGGIIQQGGTMLGTTRCPEFATEDTRRTALEQLRRHSVDALVVIGGNGSQAGAFALSQMGLAVVGVASTIDNDLPGSEITIGVDTALNIALEAVDRLKTTASSHGRAFLVEVMGRNRGYLALMAGLTGGAEVVVIPEAEVEPDQVAVEFRKAYERGKAHAIAVVAEGARNNAAAMARHFAEHQDSIGFELRVTTLGHVQRGGAPGAFDRALATRLGAAAVECIARQQTGVLVGLLRGEISTTPLSEVAGRPKPLDLKLLKLAEILAM
jgi:6-phosphofructokinase 1